MINPKSRKGTNSSAPTMPNWNGDWVSWRTSQGSARIVTWLPTVEIDEPAQKRRNVRSLASRLFRGA
jgi:hypothetical protein